MNLSEEHTDRCRRTGTRGTRDGRSAIAEPGSPESGCVWAVDVDVDVGRSPLTGPCRTARGELLVCCSSTERLCSVLPCFGGSARWRTGGTGGGRGCVSGYDEVCPGGRNVPEIENSTHGDGECRETSPAAVVEVG